MWRVLRSQRVLKQGPLAALREPASALRFQLWANEVLWAHYHDNPRTNSKTRAYYNRALNPGLLELRIIYGPKKFLLILFYFGRYASLYVEHMVAAGYGLAWAGRAS